MPNLIDMPVDYALAEVKKTGAYVEVAGEGEKVISTLPVPGTKVGKGDVVLIKTE